MHFSAFLFVFLAGLVYCSATVEEHKTEKSYSIPGLGEVGGYRRHQERKPRAERKEKEEEHKFKLDERSKELLIKEKSEHFFFQKAKDYFLSNPVTKRNRECFAKFKPGQSIDFVIDLAPSPSHDKVDKMSAESPIGLYLEHTFQTASRAYFNALHLFIDAVTIDMKPELTHTVLYENGTKFFIRGRDLEDEEALKKFQSGGEFSDKNRNLNTLWTVPTKECITKLSPLVRNCLGDMTKLALFNRDNGVPVVLNANRRSKPVYTVVITDGWSGAKIDELVDDLSRTTVIDIGNHRFVKELDWDKMKQLSGGVFTLAAPQQLPLMFSTIRNLACRFGEN